jgi:uncharacterized protein YjiS (DUF1127 family)
VALIKARGGFVLRIHEHARATHRLRRHLIGWHSDEDARYPLALMLKRGLLEPRQSSL